MKTLQLSKIGRAKIKKGDWSLYAQDCENLSRSYLPGEWVSLILPQVDPQEKSERYIGFINLNVKPSLPILQVVSKRLAPQELEGRVEFEEGNGGENDGGNDGGNKGEFSLGKNYVLFLLQKAQQRRSLFSPLGKDFRLVYGESDFLPGLTIDKYTNYILVQINSAGIDRYREEIKLYLTQEFPDQKVLFWDREDYRANEGLPVYEDREKGAKQIEELLVHENGFELAIPGNLLQKVGYFFDHRMNRLRFEKLLQQYTGEKKRGLDLFCYTGSWGLHLLRGGVEQVQFVDASPLEEVFQKNLLQNHFEKRGSFLRSDVFSFLDKAIERGEKYQVIVSDPPAFTKAKGQKGQAINGYRKLHTKIFKLVDQKALVGIGSCTKYVDWFDLDSTIQEAASSLGKKVYLIDMGLQGPDHLMKSLKDRAHYLKFLVYYVES